MSFLAILLYVLPLPAFAHCGHLSALAGNSSCIGMAAAAAAAAAAAWGLRENSEDSSNDDEAYEEIEEELQET